MESTADITKNVIDSSERIALTAAFVKSEQGKYKDEKAMIERSCWQYVEIGIKLDRVSVLYPSKIGEKHPLIVPTTSERAQRQFYGDFVQQQHWLKPSHTQPVHHGGFWHEKYKANNYNHVIQLSDVSGLIARRPVEALFKNAVGYRHCNPIKKSTRYVDEATNLLDSITKKATMQMENQTFSGKDPVLMNAFL